MSVALDCWEESGLEDSLLALLNEQLDRFSLNRRIKDAVLYSMGSGGKLIRPRLLLGSYSDLTRRSEPDGQRSSALRAALAVELLHSASLVHDDLPAIDNDDFRRGQPSCHRRFSESTAILAGDLMVGVAFSLCDSHSSLSCVPALAEAWLLLCDGQQRDLEAINSVVDSDEMIARKTGALFQASTEIGAAVAGASEDFVQRYSAFGRLFGMAFQAFDDLLDGDCRMTNGSPEENLKVLVDQVFADLLKIEEKLGQRSTLRAIAEKVFVTRA